ncbi:MAG: hypothetical protein WBA74_25120, partial [Cyclobacteriaceae bacterium]
MSIFNDIIEKRINRAVGLTVYAGSDSVQYDVVILEKATDGDLVVVESQTVHDDQRLKDWLSEYASGLPVMWGVEGKQVLVKLYASEPVMAYEDVMKAILPNAKPEQFILNASYENGHYYCSLIREDTFQSITEGLLGLQLNLYKGFVGPVGLIPLREYIIGRQRSPSYEMGRHQFSETDGVITHINRKATDDQTAQGNLLNLSPAFLNSFGYASMFFTGSYNDLLITETPADEELPTEFVQKKLHKPFLYTSVTVLL